MATKKKYPAPREPVVVLAFFEVGPEPEAAELRKLIRSAQRAGIPLGTRVYVGTYGPSRFVAKEANVLGWLQAPLYSIQPDTSALIYAGRRFRKDDTAKTDPNYGGAIPLEKDTNGKPLPLPSKDRYAWGRELGRRFRDSMWNARREGIAVETWQFDEVLREVEVRTRHGARQADYREFTSGILDGLYHGREGDSPEQGIVWYAIARNSTFPATHATKTPKLEQFWLALNQACFRLVGQEYVEFDNSKKPEEEAQAWTEFQRLLRRAEPLGGPTRRSLGEKYMVGMSPGARPKSAKLGGNVRRLPRGQANAWRNRYVSRRVLLTPVSSFGQFNFREENAAEDVMLDAIKAAALGVARRAR